MGRKVKSKVSNKFEKNDTAFEFEENVEGFTDESESGSECKNVNGSEENEGKEKKDKSGTVLLPQKSTLSQIKNKMRRHEMYLKYKQEMKKVFIYNVLKIKMTNHTTF